MGSVSIKLCYFKHFLCIAYFSQRSGRGAGDCVGVHVQGKPEDPRTSPGHAGEDRPQGEHQSFRGPLPGCYLSARPAGCLLLQLLWHAATAHHPAGPAGAPGLGPLGEGSPLPRTGRGGGGQIPPTPQVSPPQGPEEINGLRNLTQVFTFFSILKMCCWAIFSQYTPSDPIATELDSTAPLRPTAQAHRRPGKAGWSPGEGQAGPALSRPSMGQFNWLSLGWKQQWWDLCVHTGWYFFIWQKTGWSACPMKYKICCHLPTSPSVSSWEGYFSGATSPPSSFDSLDFEHDMGAGGVPAPPSPPKRMRGPAPTLPCAAASAGSPRPLGLFPGHPGGNASHLGLLVPGMLVRGCRRS